MPTTKEIKQRMAQELLKNSTRQLIQAKARNQLQPSDFRWHGVAFITKGQQDANNR